MKRLFVLLLVACLAVPFLSASAGSLDLKALDDAALRALLEEVKAELVSRAGFTSFRVVPGKYRIGVDVPAGEFRVVLEEGDGAGVNTIRTENNTYRDMYSIGRDKPREIGRIILLDGDDLLIQTNAVVFYLETGGVTFK